MEKNKIILLHEIQDLTDENNLLRLELQKVTESIKAFKNDNVDALIISHESSRKIFTATTSDKIYRILIGKNE